MNNIFGNALQIKSRAAHRALELSFAPIDFLRAVANDGFLTFISVNRTVMTDPSETQISQQFDVDTLVLDYIIAARIDGTSTSFTRGLEYLIKHNSGDVVYSDFIPDRFQVFGGQNNIRKQMFVKPMFFKASDTILIDLRFDDALGVGPIVVYTMFTCLSNILQGAY